MFTLHNQHDVAHVISDHFVVLLFKPESLIHIWVDEVTFLNPY